MKTSGMRISAFTRIFVLGVAAFLALSQPSFGRGGGHGGGGHRGGGHFGGGHSGGFHGGRLPTASRAGRQTVQRGPESDARLAGHNSSSQSTSLSRGSTTDRRGGATDLAADSHRDTTAEGAESSRDRSPQRRQTENDRRDYWNRWGNENDRRVEQFRTNREQQWSRVDRL